ncbi:MAG: hypothetical protein KBG83_00520 [Bacteroidetes bacterium]|nr:hypothetical protein [Bacteroidota bacterium]
MASSSQRDWSFLRWILISFAIAAALTYYPISEIASPEILRSIIAGGCMCFVNGILGYIAIEIGFKKSQTAFLKIIIGGMLFRLIFLWSILLILIKYYQFHAASLMLSLLFFYVLTLVLEIIYLQKKISVKR